MFHSTLRALLLVPLCFFLVASKHFPTQQKQFANCNNCYAVVAYDILKFHQPRLNVTIKDLMKKSKQTCNGGTPTSIWQEFFPRGFRKTSGSLLALQRILRKNGPCAVNHGKGHLVTAVSANQNGVLVRDPATGQQRMLSVHDAAQRKESLYFNFIAYPLP